MAGGGLLPTRARLKLRLPRGTRDPRLGEGQRWWTVESAFVFFFCVNLLNYIDRGIAPGAAAEFNAFITRSLGTDSPDLFLGLLQSAFIVGFSLAALAFGHAVHYCHPFRMVGCGLAIWVGATLMSGLARSVGKYEFLFVARMLSGVGEASFQCVIPPFITDLGGAAAGRWLALFYTAIPLGTAIGYPWGSLFATSSLGWAWAFYVESLLMLPVAALCFFLPFTWRPERAPIEDEDDEDNEAEDVKTGESGVNGEERERRLSLERHAPEDARVRATAAHMSLKDEFLAVVRRPVYLLNVFGYAATTGMMIGVSTFGSALFLEFGYFKRESSASTVFGITLSLAGLLGTPLGGALIDRQRAHAHSEEAKLAYILRQNTLLSLAGAAFCCLSCFIYARAPFLLCFVLGALLLFVCTAGINLCTMLAVPPANRSFAIAISTLCIHAFGDVPSPIVVGALLDRMAPACAADLKQNGNEANSSSDFVVSPECEAQIPKVRWTLFLVCAWLAITVACFAAAWALAARQYARHHPSSGAVVVVGAEGDGEGDEKRRPLLEGEGQQQQQQQGRRGREIVL